MKNKARALITMCQFLSKMSQEGYVIESVATDEDERFKCYVTRIGTMSNIPKAKRWLCVNEWSEFNGNDGELLALSLIERIEQNASAD